MRSCVYVRLFAFLLTTLCLAGGAFAATAIHSDTVSYTIDASGSYTLDSVTLTKGVFISGSFNDTLTISKKVTITGTDSVPGIYVPPGATLVINGSGTLNVKGGIYAAAIGGSDSQKWSNSTGTIIIEGGVSVNAEGGMLAAGIGGGYQGSGGTIIIGAKNLNVVGGYGAAAIGGGEYGVGGTIKILSGTVRATGGKWAAAIGAGGYGSTSGTIEVSGRAIVVATGGENGAGIGGGKYGAGGSITIHEGANVSAMGGTLAAGIGGGEYGARGMIVISDSAVVTAKAGYGGAGIGSGEYGAGGTIVISGGTVRATGGYAGAGIGGGGYGASGGTVASGGVIISKNANITASGGTGGAGIGGGCYGAGGNVSVSDSAVVNATGGANAAGIGGGQSGAGGTINIIEQATVTATGGHSGSGVGGGWHGAGGLINIKDNARVTATGGATAAGIGGGNRGASGAITFEGKPTVTAFSGSTGAGIGGGENGAGNTINIFGGNITAYSTVSGAGIGGGDNAPGGTINISGGNITAFSTVSGAGIGSGNGNKISLDGSNITISGGIVNATGGSSGYWNDSYYTAAGAGIGGGGSCSLGEFAVQGGNINITGGIIFANGGSASTSYPFGAPGIGGGGAHAAEYAAEAGKVSISGGFVKAVGSMYAAGIGGGRYGNFEKKPTITGGLIIAIGSFFKIGSGYGSSVESEYAKTSLHTAESGPIIFVGTDPSVLTYRLSDALNATGSTFKVTKGALAGGYTLIVPKDTTLHIRSNKIFTNRGKIENEGTINIYGTLKQSGVLSGPGPVYTHITVDNEMENGKVSLSEDSVIFDGKNKVVATAVPDIGYSLSEISMEDQAGNVLGKGSNSIIYTVGTTALKVSASFIVNPYMITAAKPQNGTITLGSSVLTYNDTLKVTATPNLGYYLDTLYYTNKFGNGTMLFADSSASEFEQIMTMPASDIKFFAEFGKVSYRVLAGEVANATLELSDSVRTYGDELTAVVAPDSDYYVASVYYVTSTGKRETVYTGKPQENGVVRQGFPMPASNVSVKASIMPRPYSVAVGEAVGGKLSLSSESVGHGTKFTVTSTPFETYHLTRLFYVTSEGDTTLVSTEFSNTTRNFSIRMPKSDLTVYAEYESLPFMIAYYEISSKGGAVFGPAMASYGDFVTLTLVPEAGYEPLLLLVSGEPIPDENIVENEDGTYTATFEMTGSQVSVTSMFGEL